MRRYEVDQITYRVNRLNIGGQPGAYPVVMIGTMFHPGHRLVTDPRRGSFDRGAAKEQLEAERELSESTGLPRMTHVVGETPSALFKYLEFVSEHSQDPIVIDSPAPETRTEICNELADTKIADRTVFNAVTEDSDQEELLAVSKLAAVICIAGSLERRMKPDRRLRALEEDILPKVRDAGIDNVLIDAGAADLASLGWTAQSIERIKGALGLPVGCAPMHAFQAWRRAARVRPPASDATAGAALGMMLSAGADFLFYGPVNNAPWLYPMCAAVNAVMAYAGRNVGTRPATRQHPLFQMF